MLAIADRRRADAARTPSPFALHDDACYLRWRARKLADRAHRADELIVDVADPARLTAAERAALLSRCARWNMAIYRSAMRADDASVAVAVGAQLGLHRLDANWLADEDGVSRITVSRAEGAAALPANPASADLSPGGRPAAAHPDDRGGFIPYTDRPIQWHTDGYYHPDERRIRAMVLHCVRPAREGGVNALLDHELAYIALRDESPEWVHALMAPDAMTIPARESAPRRLHTAAAPRGGLSRPAEPDLLSADGRIERAAQSGPVFSVDPDDGTLHMRYTARKRSIAWKDDAATRAAVEALARLLGSAGHPWVLRVRLEAGMGIVANNVLHDRSGFVDDLAAPRLLLRARYLDRTPAFA